MISWELPGECMDLQKAVSDPKGLAAAGCQLAIFLKVHFILQRRLECHTTVASIITTVHVFKNVINS
jgi:hypothetical protein